jgi:hypothetical protein
MVKGDSTVTEFVIAGDDKNFLPAEVKIGKEPIVVWNKQITNLLPFVFLSVTSVCLMCLTKKDYRLYLSEQIIGKSLLQNSNNTASLITSWVENCPDNIFSAP